MLQSFLRFLSSFTFLATIVFTIPLTFDVGGRTCGLAFSLSLFVFYGLFSILRLASPREARVRHILVNIVGSLQWLVILGLMIWALARYSVDSNSRGSWVERTFDTKDSLEKETVKEWITEHNRFLEDFTISMWDKMLRWGIPICQIAEGFCSLLVIQACGQITKYLVNGENGDQWMIGLLVTSASVSSTAVYFLYRITTFPEIGNLEAIMMGGAIACALMLGAWGIGSGRGNPVESSLLFAYITLCIYQIFTDYRPNNPVPTEQLPPQPEFPPFPPIIMASYSTLLHILSNLPSFFHSASGFVMAAVMTITPSVIISLAYRVFVMYSSTRIIPAVRASGARALSQEPSLDDTDEIGQVLGLARWFSPSILIAVYTSLLMQHFASTSANGSGDAEWWTSQGGDAGSDWSRWINLALTMVLYAVELHLGRNDDETLTSHWKTD